MNLYIRHITGVFQGFLISTIGKFKEREKIAKSGIHEHQKKHGDRLLSNKDLNIKSELGGEVIKIAFDGKFNL